MNNFVFCNSHSNQKSCTVHISKNPTALLPSAQFWPMVRTKEQFGVFPCLSFEYLYGQLSLLTSWLFVLQFAFRTKSSTFHISYVLYLQSPMTLFPVHNSGQWFERRSKDQQKAPKLHLCVPIVLPSAFETNRGILTVPLWMIWRPHVNSTFWILSWKWVVLCPKRRMLATPSTFSLVSVSVAVPTFAPKQVGYS